MRRGVRTITIATAAVAAVLLAASGTACACSCVGLTDDEALARSAAVFVGTLREVRGPEVMLSSSAPSRFLFEVDAVFKGSVHEVQSIVSASDGASCGLELDVGDRAVVFATGAASYSLEPGEYEAGLCDGTRSFGAVGLPDGLGPAGAPLPGSSPVGDDDSFPSMIVRNWYWLVGGLIVVVGGAVGGVLYVRRRAGPR